MDRTEILSKVADVCAETFMVGVQDIDESKDLALDLSCDSLKKIIFINEVENKFGIMFEFDESQLMKTVKDVVDIVEKHL